MALRTTDTRTPLTVRVWGSVVILARDQFQCRFDPCPSGLITERRRDGLPHPPGLHGVAAPVVLHAGSDGLVNLHCQGLVPTEVVEQRPPGLGVQRWGVTSG